MRIPKEERPHFSYSQLVCYLQCPLQYHFQYELGIAWEQTPSAVIFGSCVHDAVEVANLNLMYGELDPNAVIKDFIKHWEEVTDGEVLWKDEFEKDELLIKGKALIELYCDAVKEDRPTEVELPFRLPIIDPKTGIFLSSRDFVGKIDAIFAGDTIVEIKTTSRSPVQQEVDQNLQLTLYSWAYRMLYGQPETSIKVVNLVKTKVPKLVVTETHRSERDHSWLIATTTQVVRAIGQKIFYPNPIGGFGCFNCQYQQYCIEDNGSEHNFLRSKVSGVGSPVESYARD